MDVVTDYKIICDFRISSETTRTPKFVWFQPLKAWVELK